MQDTECPRTQGRAQPLSAGRQAHSVVPEVADDGRAERVLTQLVVPAIGRLVETRAPGIPTQLLDGVDLAFAPAARFSAELLAADRLAPTGWTAPDASAYPTGADWAEQYLQPLANALGDAPCSPPRPPARSASTPCLHAASTQRGAGQVRHLRPRPRCAVLSELSSAAPSPSPAPSAPSSPRSHR